MFKMRFGTALALLAAVVSPLLLECTTTCQMGNPNDYVEGRCPVNLTSVRSQDTEGIYSVTVRVWIKADDFFKSPKIEVLSPVAKETLWPTLKKRKSKAKCNRCLGERVRCDRGVTQPYRSTTFDLWEVVHDVRVRAGKLVNVSYSTKSTSCSVIYRVPDPAPDFELSVNQSSKSIIVTVEPGDKVYARWCQKNGVYCIESDSPRIPIDPSKSRSAPLDVPHLLPCLCVQVYYTYRDASRRQKCPFQNRSIIDVRDVWRSFEITVFESALTWSSDCPASDLNISASLCWMQHEHLCTPVANSTLEKEAGLTPQYNTSAVDKHPQMCVQFSLQGSHYINCPFKAYKPSWDVYIGPGRQSLLVYLNSSAPAKFSTQLCVLTESGCTPIGPAHSVTMEGKATETRINVPLRFLVQKPCVQVWQSDPALHGRRILCPDYVHNRRGMYAVAALIFAAVVALLGIFIHRVTKSGAAGWLYFQKPLLLVCSSDQSTHVSAVCALASVLQEELGATVHTALWAQSSQRQAGAGSGVADLGPLPWLYGQWEAVRKAQGKVLIIWSPEAKRTYEKWREERASMDKKEKEKEDYGKADVRHEKIGVEVEEDLKLSGRRLGKCKKKKCKKDCVEICDDKDWCLQKEPSTVIEPVFMAALACLDGALQKCKGQGVAIVYFQGLGHSRDIPKAFRGVPRYCLPQDFRGLIQELGGMKARTKTGQFKWHCWPRLLSKVLSIWLARQLAPRLQTLLPQTQGHKMQGTGVASSMKMTSDETQSRFKLPLAAGEGTGEEQELLHGSPWRAEKL